MKDIDLWLFTTDLALGRAAKDAGISGLAIDWENPVEQNRQANIEEDMSNDRSALRVLTDALDCPSICRVNQFGEQTKKEVAQALSYGASHILLPMVRSVEHANAFKELIGKRGCWGLMIETPEALVLAPKLAELEPDFVYVGFFDLMLTRGRSSLFEPLINGEVANLRVQFAGIPFGVAGMTVLGAGSPVPSAELLAELAYHNCDFTFLRRSFKRDIKGRQMKQEITRILELWRQLNDRDKSEEAKDHQRFIGLINALF